jgi:hypothetical protein
LPKPEREDVYEWVQQAFLAVSAKSIRKTFAHIGYIEKSAVDDDNDSDEQEEEGAGSLDEGLENVVEVDESELIIR